MAMNKLKERFLQSSLRNKLILAFACFIIVPFFVVGGTLSWLYVNSNRTMLLDAVVENNKQVIKNIDTSLQPIMRLSILPMQDKTLLQMMNKDYAASPYPLYEREKDFDTAGGIIKNSMLLNSDLIDSVVIYQNTNKIILGRSHNDYMNHAYLQSDFANESFVRKVLEKKGENVPIGIHSDQLMSFRGTPVVSVGRAIVDPYTKEDLGFILLNVGIDKLKTLWSDIHFTNHTRFYLVDEQQRLIYSQNNDEIGSLVSDVLGSEFDSIRGEGKDYRQDREHYLISATAASANWTAITVIPKSELFGFVNTIVQTIAISLLVLLVLSIITSVYIATGITKPLLILQRKMKLVSQGNLDVTIDIQKGEVGKISMTIDNMLAEIRRMIGQIYRDEQEKRQLEMLALQSQIKPHFMYNTLNVIKWMAKIQGASGIEEALGAFSAVIRFTAKTESDFVTVAEEAAFIRNYTHILDVRYFNKFELSMDIQPEVMSYQTLKFLLQPLVENAIFHGFDEIPYKGKLGIRIYEETGHLVMLVTDNGRGMSQQEDEKPAATGGQLNAIGMDNIRKRIELHFGDAYGLWITSGPDQGTTAKIIVPIINGQGTGE
ncbi:sensor histidine kinase [Paenibacillus nasutitermitis]|uniref:Sensor histidine kinase n=2 Tax=Paenibacillus nasutitermitis TaxID=1652958 RepID=A0A916YJP4_9BACL|nr:sensor histidine kinase [Paenibacillus nasutitermitis]